MVAEITSDPIINAATHAVIHAEEEGVGEDTIENTDVVGTETAAVTHAVIHAVMILMTKMIAAVIHVVTHAAIPAETLAHSDLEVALDLAEAVAG